MKKKLITVIAIVAVVAMLSGALAILANDKSFRASSSSSEETSSRESIPLISESVDQFQSAKIQNMSGTFTIEKINGTWGIRELSGFLVDDSKFSSDVGSLSSMAADCLIAKDCTDLKEYGLQKPQGTAIIKFKNGKTDTLAVGSSAPNGTTRYVTLNGGKDVYQVAETSVSALIGTKTDYLNKTIVTSSDSTPKFTYIALSHPGEKPIIFNNTKPDYAGAHVVDMLRMVSPVEGVLNETALKDTIDTVFGLEADSVVKLNPTAQELAAYGFSKPTTLELHYGKTSLKLLVGNALDENKKKTTDSTAAMSYYVKKDGVNEVFSVSASNLKWVTMQAKDLMSAVLALIDIQDVKSIDVTTDKTHTIQIENTSAKTASSSGIETKFTADGNLVKAENGSNFYSLLLTTTAQDVNTKKPVGKPALSVVYHLTNGKTVREDSYVEPDNTTILSLNGNNGYIGRVDYVTKVKTELAHLLKGQTVDTGY